MGEVYRARDTRLGRDVAVKVLPISSHGDADRRARFEREAQALAALNHPHIAAIHDVVDAGDHRAIVMELVSGQTLAQRMALGPVSVRDAIGYGIDISDALSAAHAGGIVHRDLKPANVVITEGGSAKVLDFGIAKRHGGSDATAAVTMTGLTGERSLIGTVGYMSPEQANGREVDARGDIFSLGAVLYEALSGRRAFQGDTTATILSSVLRDDPPSLRTLVPQLPRGLERSVMRCLDKDPRRRYQSAADLKLVLEDLLDDLSTPESTAPSGSVGGAFGHRRRRWLWPVLGIATIVVATMGFVAGVGSRTTPPLPHYRPLITEVTSANHPVWSPDGRTLTYLDVVDGRGHLLMRDIDSPQSTVLARNAASTIPPFWSPDGSKIYFSRNDFRLVSVSAGGGEPQPVIEDRSSGGELEGLASISPDGDTIVYGRGTTGKIDLWALDTRNGQARALAVSGLPQLVFVAAVAFAPDGRSFAMIASDTAANQARGIWVVSWPHAVARRLAADSPYVFEGPGTISWMPDSRRVVVSGTPRSGEPARLLMVDIADGRLSSIAAAKDPETGPAVSPDGRRLAFVSRGWDTDLVRLPVDGGPPEPVVATLQNETFPDMRPSGQLVYTTNATGTVAIRFRSPGDTWSRPVQLGNALGDGGMAEVRLSPDGQRIALTTMAGDHVIWVVPTAGGAPVRLDSETTDQHGPSWSPDGGWIAYRRLFKGTWSMVKTPIGGGTTVRLDDANSGGGLSDWSPDGQWIAHSRPDGIHLVPANDGPVRVLAGLRGVANAFRFSRDGKRLLAIRRGDRREWQLATWDVAAGRELSVVSLPVAAAASVPFMTLAEHDSHILVAVASTRSDIWLLEDFDHPAPWWSRWFAGLGL
jgi:serine/threonine protein kinase